MTGCGMRRTYAGRLLMAAVLGSSMLQFSTCGVTDLQARDFFTSTLIRTGLQTLSTYLQAAIIAGQSA